MSDLKQADLLKRFEPILKFNQGERFFPYNVEDYVEKANLWVKEPKRPAEELFSEEELDLEKLGSLRLTGARNVHYLQFISPFNLGELAEIRFNELRKALKNREFQPTRSRLARVGYLARIVDAAFSLMLLLRGRVPGDAMAAAVITFDKMLERKRSFKYYGRVIRQSGWVVLQYWYFYAFNNWRTGFFGANDHEADWEMVNIYCYQDPAGDLRPAWLGYACHNYTGDDLRRHWNDPEIEKVGEHPVVFVGGGSHASYFQRGEYLTQLSLPFLSPLQKATKIIDKLFGKLFREKRYGQEDESDTAFTIPFVDYALGDGLSIGPDGDEPWSDPGVIEPPPEWVMNFRGLWGLYAQDPFSGEDAPAGPRYNRDGSVRQAWFDPLGWAGLEKVVPPAEQADLFQTRKAGIREEVQSLENEIDSLQDIHYQRGIDQVAIRDEPHLQNELVRVNKLLEEEMAALAEKRRQLTIKKAMLNSLELHADEVSNGKQYPIRAHIKNPHLPQSKKDLRFSGLAEVWAAISIGLMMIAVVVLIVFARPFFVAGLIGLFLVMVSIEAAFRRRLSVVVRWFAILLAMAGLLILIYEFFWFIILGIMMVIGFYMIIENLRELAARR